MEKIRKLLDWCLKKGNRGIVITEPNKELAVEHINKALHNLNAMDYFSKGNFSDWAVSAAFYAAYHAFLAILFKFGYESKNQECTIAAVEYLIANEKIKLDKKYIEFVRNTKEIVPKSVKLLREEFQYGIDISVNPAIISYIKKNTIELVEAVQLALEDLK